MDCESHLKEGSETYCYVTDSSPSLGGGSTHR